MVYVAQVASPLDQENQPNPINLIWSKNAILSIFDIQRSKKSIETACNTVLR